MDRTMGRVAGNTQRTARATESLNRTVGAGVRGVIAYSAAWGGLHSVLDLSRNLIEARNRIDQIDRSLVIATGSVPRAREEFAFLRSESDRLGVSMQETAPGITRFLGALGSASLTADEGREAISGLLETMAVLGTSSERSKLVVLAFEQMLAKGRVASEEIRRQLGDNLPRAMEFAARSAGMSMAEFNEALELGKINANDFVLSFTRVLRDEMAPQLQEAMDAPRVSFEKLKNAVFLDLLGVMQEEVVPVLADAADQISEFLNTEDGRRQIQELGSSIASVMEVVLKILTVLGKFALEADGLTVATLPALGAALVASFTPLGPAGIAIAGVSAALISLGINFKREWVDGERWVRMTRELVEETGNLGDVLEGLDQSISRLHGRKLADAEATNKATLAHIKQMKVVAARMKVDDARLKLLKAQDEYNRKQLTGTNDLDERVNLSRAKREFEEAIEQMGALGRQILDLRREGEALQEQREREDEALQKAIDRAGEYYVELIGVSEAQEQVEASLAAANDRLAESKTHLKELRDSLGNYKEFLEVDEDLFERHNPIPEIDLPVFDLPEPLFLSENEEDRIRATVEHFEEMGLRVEDARIMARLFSDDISSLWGNLSKSRDLVEAFQAIWSAVGGDREILNTLDAADIKLNAMLEKASGWMGVLGQLGSAIGGDIGQAIQGIQQTFGAFQAYQATGGASLGVPQNAQQAGAGMAFGSSLGSTLNGMGIGQGDRGTSQFGGQRSGDYSDIGAMVGGIFGPWGAVIGFVVGLAIKKGADEGLATVRAYGNEVATAIQKDEAGLGGILGKVGKSFEKAWNGIEQKIGAELANVPIDLKIRNDQITVFIGTMSRSFKSAEEAINFMVSSSIGYINEFGNVDAEIQAALQSVRITDTIEDISRKLDVATAIRDLRLDQELGAGAAKFRSTLQGYFQLIKEGLEMNIDVTPVFKAMTSTMLEARDSILGIERSESELIRSRAQAFDANVKWLRAEILARIASIESQKAAIQGYGALGGSLGTVGQVFVQTAEVAALSAQPIALAATSAAESNATYAQSLGAVSSATIASAKVSASAAGTFAATANAQTAALAAARQALASLEGLEISEREIQEAIARANRASGSAGGGGGASSRREFRESFQADLRLREIAAEFGQVVADMISSLDGLTEQLQEQERNGVSGEDRAAFERLELDRLTEDFRSQFEDDAESVASVTAEMGEALDSAFQLAQRRAEAFGTTLAFEMGQLEPLIREHFGQRLRDLISGQVGEAVGNRDLDALLGIRDSLRGQQLSRGETPQAGMMRELVGEVEDGLIQLRDTVAGEFSPVLYQARREAEEFAESFLLLQRVVEETGEGAEVLAEIASQAENELLGIAQGILSQMGNTQAARDLEERLSAAKFYIEIARLRILYEQYLALGIISEAVATTIAEVLELAESFDPSNLVGFNPPPGGGVGAGGGGGGTGNHAADTDDAVARLLEELERLENADSGDRLAEINAQFDDMLERFTDPVLMQAWMRLGLTFEDLEARIESLRQNAIKKLDEDLAAIRSDIRNPTESLESRAGVLQEYDRLLELADRARNDPGYREEYAAELSEFRSLVDRVFGGTLTGSRLDEQIALLIDSIIGPDQGGGPKPGGDGGVISGGPRDDDGGKGGFFRDSELCRRAEAKKAREQSSEQIRLLKEEIQATDQQTERNRRDREEMLGVLREISGHLSVSRTAPIRTGRTELL